MTTREALRYELARREFWSFCLLYDKDFYTRRPFLEKVADAFQQIYEGKIKSLSVSMPPRAGKSYITTLFSAWFLGNRNKESIMRNTCTARLYNKFSYDARAVIRTDKYKLVFPNAELAEDRQDISGWSLKTSKQVAYFGGGVGGTIIGFGASGLAITDDLYKSIDDALSENTNDTVQRWKDSAHDSRCEKDCPKIDIGTRWSMNDVIGTNSEKGNYDLSVVVPALTSEGVSFCEDVKSTEEYIKIKNDIPEEIWDSEYMQQPAELKGVLFQQKDLKRFFKADLMEENEEKVMVNRIPEGVLAYIDVADEGDDSFAMPVGKLFNNKIFITDILFNNANIDVTLPQSIEMIKRVDANYVRVESNNQGSIVIKMMREELDGEKILPVHNSANKHTRVLLTYAFIKKHFYFLDKSEIEFNSDYYKFMKELFKYMKNGSSAHDDAPDSLSGLAVFCKSFFPHLFE